MTKFQYQWDMLNFEIVVMVKIQLFTKQLNHDRTPVAQLVKHRVIMREAVSSTPAGPTLRVLK